MHLDVDPTKDQKQNNRFWVDSNTKTLQAGTQLFVITTKAAFHLGEDKMPTGSSAVEDKEQVTNNPASTPKVSVIPKRGTSSGTDAGFASRYSILVTTTSYEETSSKMNKLTFK